MGREYEIYDKEETRGWLREQEGHLAPTSWIQMQEGLPLPIINKSGCRLGTGVTTGNESRTPSSGGAPLPPERTHPMERSEFKILNDIRHNVLCAFRKKQFRGNYLWYRLWVGIVACSCNMWSVKSPLLKGIHY